MDLSPWDYWQSGGAQPKPRTAELLAAIQQGRLWVNMREVETGWPELWAAAMAEFGMPVAAE